MQRGIMHHKSQMYGPNCQIWTMYGNEAGYSDHMLVSIRIPDEAVRLISEGHAVRILRDGVEIIEGETAGLIVFGRYKGDRPALIKDYNPAAELGRKGGSTRSPRKADAARKNAQLGGRPKGSSGLTDLQRQAWDLRQQGLKIREIAARMGRQPENVRQLLARAQHNIERG